MKVPMAFRAFLFFFSFFVSIADAEYVSALKNQNVCTQFKDDLNRKIPQTEWFCLGLDSVGFFRALGTEEFYHGFGHWSQLRSEFSFNEFSKLNLRTVFFSGSSSNGYAQPSGFYTLYSLKTLWPEKISGGALSLRILDQDRLTTGVGLFIQDKESNGVRLDWIFENFSFIIKGESTGAFLLGDDVHNFEIKENSDSIGTGIVIFPAGSQSGLLENRKPYYYLFSFLPNDFIDLSAEVGQRNKAWSGLLKLNRKFESNGFAAAFELQYRQYGNDFAEQIAGQIDHQYVSLDQLDKPMMNAINIFVVDDDVKATSFNGDFFYRLNSFHRFGFLNEFARFDYRDLFRKDFYFFRAEYSYSPIQNRDDAIVFFISNKTLAHSDSIPPKDLSFADSEPLFKQVGYVGLEGRFRF
jgi:hypothetical protein